MAKETVLEGEIRGIQANTFCSMYKDKDPPRAVPLSLFFFRTKINTFDILDLATITPEKLRMRPPCRVKTRGI